MRTPTNMPENTVRETRAAEPTPRDPEAGSQAPSSPDPSGPTSPALAVDFGERRIGLAISDDTGVLALPLETVTRDTDRRAVYRIADIAASRDARSLIVGAPRHVDGSPSFNLPRIERFAAKLAKVTKLPLYWVEETLSTAEADARLGGRPGVRPRIGDTRRDMVAAQVILEDALGGGARRAANPTAEP